MLTTKRRIRMILEHISACYTGSHFKPRIPPPLRGGDQGRGIYYLPLTPPSPAKGRGNNCYMTKRRIRLNLEYMGTRYAGWHLP